MDPIPFTAVDRDLLKRCLSRSPGSWNDFVDRFLSLIYHVVGYTAHLRSAPIGPEDVEDIAAEILLKIVADDFRTLRAFRGQSSLATYLTVVSRRICIQELARRQKSRAVSSRVDEDMLGAGVAALKGMESLEDVEKLLKALPGKQREIVRLYYLEGRTYEEISTETEVPVNTIGTVLSRARAKLRESAEAAAPPAKAKVPPRGPLPKSGAVRKVAPPTGEDGPTPKPAAHPKSGAVRKVSAPPPSVAEETPAPANQPKTGAVRKVSGPPVAPTAEATAPAAPAKPTKPAKPTPDEADEE